MINKDKDNQFRKWVVKNMQNSYSIMKTSDEVICSK